jgi:uncharacterized repeat protein (TIGR04052 family)
LKFAAAVNDQSARCGVAYSGLGTTDATAEILDLRLYVSNVRLVNAAGEEVVLDLESDGRWQVDNVALLDFEDGSGRCGDAGTAEVRGEITGAVPEGEYHGIRFDVAVPFALNHLDAAAAPAPLNVSAMYWTWAVGYKFLRVDLETEGGVPWSLHVGSTMCDSDGPADPPSIECARPNRAQVAFDSFDPDHDTIVIDLDRLFSATDLTVDTPDSSTGCQSFADDAVECAPLFSSLGLDYATGTCEGDCANQTAFRLRNLEASDTERLAAIARGSSAFSTSWQTVGGELLACAGCHGADGSGAVGPDLRPSAAEHLVEHARDDGPHPAGVKFVGLTAADFDDLGAFLASLCAADPDCEPAEEEDQHHE